MRTLEVQQAIDGVGKVGYGQVLAAEVERLEKREKELEADLDAYAPPVLQDGRPIFDSFGSKLRRDVRARAEAAEARVAELEERLKGTMQAGGYEFFMDELRHEQKATNNAVYVAQQLEKKVAELEAQNARLRAAYHTMRVKVVQIANGEPEEMRDALFSLTKETDALSGEARETSLFPTMTPDIMAQLIRAARRRRAERRGAWRNAINTFRPANPAKSKDVSCVVSTSDAASCEGSQGGATSASPSGDSVRGNATA